MGRNLVGMASGETDAMRDLRARAAADLEAVGQAPISQLERALLAAHLAIATRRWVDAAQLARDALELDVSWEAYWLWGLAHAGANEDIPTAIAKLEQAVFLGRGFADAWMLLAEARTYELSRRRHAEDVREHIPAALAALEEADRLGADEERVRFLAALLHWVWGNEDLVAGLDPHQRYAEGIAYLEQSAAGERDAFHYFVEGRLREKFAQTAPEGKLDRREHLEAAVDLQARGVEEFARNFGGVVFAPGLRERAHALRALADVVHAAGDDPRSILEEAVADYTASLEAEPGNGAALLYRGGAHHELAGQLRLTRGDPAEVAAHYAACTRDLRGMNDPEAWLPRGVALLWAGLEAIDRGDDAAESMRRAQEDLAAVLAHWGEPEPQLLLALGLAHLYRGRAAADRGEDAGDSFAKAEELFARVEWPTLWPLLRQLEARLRGKGADQKSLDLLEECIGEAAGLSPEDLTGNAFDAERALSSLRPLVESGGELARGLDAVAAALTE
jgi:hypothetical protein